MRPKGITGHIKTAPYTQLFAILKKAMCDVIKVYVSYHVIFSMMCQCFIVVQFKK